MRRWAPLLALALALGTVGVAWAATPTATTDDAATMRQVCEAALRASPSLSSADRTWAQRCTRVAAAAAGVFASPSANPSPSPSASPSPTPSPTATPGPTPTGLPLNCRTDPSRCGYPDADNTGVPPGTTLEVIAPAQGYLDVTAAGTVFDSKDIRGCLIIKAPNITIRNSKVSCSNFGVIYSVPWNYSGGGVLVEDSEITCNNTISSGISSYGVTARRVDIHHCADGLNVDNGITLEDSYIHDLIDPATGAHTDGVQMQGNPTGIVIRHNTLFADCCPYGNSAITMAVQTESVLVENNFVGGGTYTIYCPQVTVPVGAVRILGNRFADGMQEYGLSLSCDGGDITWTGNYRDSNGSVVAP